MKNRTWGVLWRDKENKPRKKECGTVLKEALAFAKSLREQGLDPSILSGHPYPPQKNSGPRPGRAFLWCPYCIAYRKFTVRAIRRDGIRGPELLRCPVCTISTSDWYVRKHNGLLGIADDAQLRKGLLVMDRG